MRGARICAVAICLCRCLSDSERLIIVRLTGSCVTNSRYIVRLLHKNSPYGSPRYLSAVYKNSVLFLYTAGHWLRATSEMMVIQRYACSSPEFPAAAAGAPSTYAHHLAEHRRENTQFYI